MFSIAAKKYHKINDLKKYPFIISVSLEQDVGYELPRSSAQGLNR